MRHFRRRCRLSLSFYLPCARDFCKKKGEKEKRKSRNERRVRVHIRAFASQASRRLLYSETIHIFLHGIFLTERNEYTRHVSAESCTREREIFGMRSTTEYLSARGRVAGRPAGNGGTRCSPKVTKREKLIAARWWLSR